MTLDPHLDALGHGSGSIHDLRLMIGARCYDLAPELFGGPPSDPLAREVTFHDFPVEKDSE